MPEGVNVTQLWEKLTQKVSESSSKAVEAVLDQMDPGELKRGTFELKLFNPGREPIARAVMPEIEQLVSDIAGGPVKLQLRIEEQPDKPKQTAPSPIPQQRIVHAKDIEKAEADPLIKRAMELFDARIVDVQVGDVRIDPAAEQDTHQDVHQDVQQDAQ